MNQEDLGDEFAEFATESLELADAYIGAFPTGYVDDHPPDPPQAKWRIWSNVHQQWYGPQARCYTPRIEDSGRFMPMEALQIYYNAARGWNPDQPFAIGVTLVPA